MQNTYLRNNIMVVSPVVFSGITFELHVDQIVMSTLALADSLMMMQLCCYYWDVNSLQQCAWSLATPTISYLVGQHTVKLRLHRITCAADVTQDATKRDLLAHALSAGNTLWHSSVYRRLRPKQVVSEGLMALAWDKWPEAKPAYWVESDAFATWYL